MSPRTRILAFGTAATVAIAGGICGALIHGLIGQLLAFVLISFGLGGAVLLVFLEVGLGEDRDRARAQASASERPARAQASASERPARATKTRQGPRPQPPRWPRRPG